MNQSNSNELNKGGLHLNPRGLGKPKFAMTWLVNDSFHKASSFDFR